MSIAEQHAVIDAFLKLASGLLCGATLNCAAICCRASHYMAASFVIAGKDGELCAAAAHEQVAQCNRHAALHSHQSVLKQCTISKADTCNLTSTTCLIA